MPSLTSPRGAAPPPEPAAGPELAAADGGELNSLLGPQRDIATIIFRKFNVSKSGALTTDELQALCADMEHPADEAGAKLAQALLDLKGDGRLTLEVFQAWWHEGDHRWELFDMSEAQRERAQALVAFFEAFEPVKGTLTGVGLARMHACLADRALTTKTLFAFLHDADPDIETEQLSDSLTLYKLHKWFFREERLSEPLEPPTLADRRRPVLESYVESREDFLQEESNTKRERNAVLDKAQASGDALGVAVNATDSLPNALEA